MDITNVERNRERRARDAERAAHPEQMHEMTNSGIQEWLGRLFAESRAEGPDSPAVARFISLFQTAMQRVEYDYLRKTGRITD